MGCNTGISKKLHCHYEFRRCHAPNPFCTRIFAANRTGSEIYCTGICNLLDLLITYSSLSGYKKATSKLVT
jgi:hypothetical protein